MLDLAKHIIQTKMSHFDITKFEDRYENALIEMIRAKQAGRPIEAQKPKQPADVVNLMDALRKSIAAETGAKEAQQAAVEGEKPKSARRAAKAPVGEGNRLRNAAEARVEPRRTGRAKSDAEPSPPAAAKPARKTAGRR
jgi:DNA end-binding protein Ku